MTPSPWDLDNAGSGRGLCPVNSSSPPLLPAILKMAEVETRSTRSFNSDAERPEMAHRMAAFGTVARHVMAAAVPTVSQS